jgi:hypothetical protein
MAIVKLQSPIAGLRGKYGGMIFSANGSGPYVRQWCMPPDPKSVLQTPLRADLTSIRHSWSNLTQGQIDDWNALAAAPPEIDYNSLGEEILLSGSAWHTRVNMRRVLSGDAIEDNCPVNTPVDPPLSFGLYCNDFFDAFPLAFFSYTDDDFDGFYAVLHISVASSSVLQSKTTGFRLVWSNTVTDGTLQDIMSELVTVFGSLTIGNRLFGRLYKQSTTGIRSTPLTSYIDVVPVP